VAITVIALGQPGDGCAAGPTQHVARVPLRPAAAARSRQCLRQAGYLVEIVRSARPSSPCGGATFRRKFSSTSWTPHRRLQPGSGV